jgi:hypothetical protein
MYGLVTRVVVGAGSGALTGALSGATTGAIAGGFVAGPGGIAAGALAGAGAGALAGALAGAIGGAFACQQDTLWDIASSAGLQGIMAGALAGIPAGRAAGEAVLSARSAANNALGELVKVNGQDRAADALARRLGGEPRVRFAKGPTNEFDAVSDKFIAQTKPANFKLNKTFRLQAKTTFETALKTGRRPYFHFEGPPHRDVLRKLVEYGKRYGVKPVIDTTPL